VTDDGTFNPAARATILEAGHGRCVGCGAPDVSCQHRRARGMGGTTSVTIGHPANGVPLCGGALAGVRGCHGWAEHQPTDAALLGWRLLPGEDPLVAPWWDRVYGWRRWVVEPDGFVSLVFVDPETELDRLPLRANALARFRVARLTGVRSRA
jgi:hypothetical protein